MFDPVISLVFKATFTVKARPLLGTCFFSNLSQYALQTCLNCLCCSQGLMTGQQTNKKLFHIKALTV